MNITETDDVQTILERADVDKYRRRDAVRHRAEVRLEGALDLADGMFLKTNLCQHCGAIGGVEERRRLPNIDRLESEPVPMRRSHRYGSGRAGGQIVTPIVQRF